MHRISSILALAACAIAPLAPLAAQAPATATQGRPTADLVVLNARIYTADDATALLAGTGLDADRFAREMEGKFLSGFVRATKPQA